MRRTRLLMADNPGLGSGRAHGWVDGPELRVLHLLVAVVGRCWLDRRDLGGGGLGVLAPSWTACTRSHVGVAAPPSKERFDDEPACCAGHARHPGLGRGACLERAL